MEKESTSELISKHKLMLCKVPDHIFKLCRQAQAASSEVNVSACLKYGFRVIHVTCQGH